MTLSEVSTPKSPIESIRVPITKVRGERTSLEDFVTIEEPLELRIAYHGRSDIEPVSFSVTMRTPGSDFELVTGFLFAEGIIKSSDDIHRLSWSDEPSLDKDLQNVVLVELASESNFNTENLLRNLITSSSCGVCSKSSIAALQTILPVQKQSDFEISEEHLTLLPRRMREIQSQFNKTGGLHACATFDRHGNIDHIAEDVGRHNAMDKLVGHFLNQHVERLESRGVLLSGRASFELVHKATMASVPLIASIGPPSSMAIELAETRDITLAGFLSESGFNVYHASGRIRD
ncbi:MAG: formate dehydrogenase accessory sulfurtransferase FdhD [Gammaproteobacteria bacterium]|nr:formate dehydrogenase accessory sulfurtransferase FdhD [Gammaproteobacteria bacterium]